jgi:hypothetical protein
VAGKELVPLRCATTEEAAKVARLAKNKPLPPTTGWARPHVPLRAPAPQAIQLPFFGGGDDFQLFPSDVEFKDVDGDYIVLRKAAGGKIDLYVNKKLKFEGARMVVNGNTLEVTGSVKQGFAFLGALGFQLEDIVTEGVTPANPADLEKAAALVA